MKESQYNKTAFAALENRVKLLTEASIFYLITIITTTAINIHPISNRNIHFDKVLPRSNPECVGRTLLDFFRLQVAHSVQRFDISLLPPKDTGFL
jgi:hypothetical protein